MSAPAPETERAVRAALAAFAVAVQPRAAPSLIRARITRAGRTTAVPGSTPETAENDRNPSERKQS